MSPLSQNPSTNPSCFLPLSDAVGLSSDIRSQVEASRDQVYAGLEFQCSQLWPGAPHGRMGRLLLRIPALHLLGLRVRTLMERTGGVHLILSELDRLFQAGQEFNAVASNDVGTSSSDFQPTVALPSTPDRAVVSSATLDHFTSFPHYLDL